MGRNPSRAAIPIASGLTSPSITPAPITTLLSKEAALLASGESRCDGGTEAGKVGVPVEGGGAEAGWEADHRSEREGAECRKQAGGFVLEGEGSGRETNCGGDGVETGNGVTRDVGNTSQAVEDGCNPKEVQTGGSTHPNGIPQRSCDRERRVRTTEQPERVSSHRAMRENTGPQATDGTSNGVCFGEIPTHSIEGEAQANPEDKKPAPPGEVPLLGRPRCFAFHALGKCDVTGCNTGCSYSHSPLTSASQLKVFVQAHKPSLEATLKNSQQGAIQTTVRRWWGPLLSQAEEANSKRDRATHLYQQFIHTLSQNPRNGSTSHTSQPPSHSLTNVQVPPRNLPHTAENRQMDSPSIWDQQGFGVPQPPGIRGESSNPAEFPYGLGPQGLPQQSAGLQPPRLPALGGLLPCRPRPTFSAPAPRHHESLAESASFFHSGRHFCEHQTPADAFQPPLASSLQMPAVASVPFMNERKEAEVHPQSLSTSVPPSANFCVTHRSADPVGGTGGPTKCRRIGERPSATDPFQPSLPGFVGSPVHEAFPVLHQSFHCRPHLPSQTLLTDSAFTGPMSPEVGPLQCSRSFKPDREIVRQCRLDLVPRPP
uniref:Uncharacterized protein n=1 Tax=Chromera velia CCMP2878 TaxID=1169474 RepID=A0A0G4F1G9_9ALVE|eukprot:Cvel_14616.t1-p1 / transcript=Cvel_14616.t1 / gene=Cvel_14616 / organism=Chromera_velia_CCMP2878 / gene_product=hypothetical protein / transcript_product=hypothetical protein / location=Cvel_scaffold1045:38435-41701(+) / protein_length=598 / sequence_SO=supercontig / SO=protein_coding / is_pseudo=false